MLPDELDVPPPDELELLDEELLEDELPDEELLEDPELLELPEEDELLDELEELEDEALPEPLFDDLPPHPASIAASSTLATSAQ